jgi:hypothetical protein
MSGCGVVVLVTGVVGRNVPCGPAWAVPDLFPRGRRLRTCVRHSVSTQVPHYGPVLDEERVLLSRFDFDCCMRRVAQRPLCFSADVHRKRLPTWSSTTMLYPQAQTKWLSLGCAATCRGRGRGQLTLVCAAASTVTSTSTGGDCIWRLLIAFRMRFLRLSEKI